MAPPGKSKYLYNAVNRSYDEYIWHFSYEKCKAWHLPNGKYVVIDRDGTSDWHDDIFQPGKWHLKPLGGL